MESEWAFWPEAAETVRILGRAHLWGRGTVDVLRPSDGTQHRLSGSVLQSVDSRPWVRDEVAYRAAAARAFYLAARGQPIALSRGSLEPLPHQLAVLDKALRAGRVRLLLADEVGLGKTIEAGLIWSELKVRRGLRRVLVVAPRGVQLQWVAEMKDRFREEFVLVGSEGVPVDVGINPWSGFDQVVCSIDAVKPLRVRRGWTPERIATHNEKRFQALIEAGWDLVVIDEAHHVAGSSEGVARHRLATELARRTENILLLSATPHSGKSESFARLLGLLVGEVLVPETLTREKVASFVVRTEKRLVTDATGAPLFHPRTTVLETVEYRERVVERKLYEAVTDYVRHGYDRSRREKRPALGFLVLLMQRLVSSSTAAIQAALERRLAAISAGQQLRLFAEGAEEWGELTGEEQFDDLTRAQGAAWREERKEVEILLDLARKARADGPDAKARHLFELLRRVQREEGDPAVKLLVFTEFLQTQEMLLDLLEQAGIAATAINGAMGLDERRVAQEEFRELAQVLVSTDAGGEGINLQFAHAVVNYDLPWNPMRIEQRIGRVDRIGQLHPVRAHNLILENSVDARLLEVLEEKLWTILRELGADKWGDVLETVSADKSVEHLYATAIMHPDQVEDEAARVARTAERIVEEQDPVRSLLTGGTTEAVPEADASRWSERALDALEAWRGVRPRREQLLAFLPEAAPPEPLPEIEGFAEGIWSLWEAGPDAARPERGFFALFSPRIGGVRPDLAEQIWLSLSDGADIRVGPPLGSDQWESLQRLGQDYAYRPCQELRPDGDWDAPYLKLRMAVRTFG